MSIQIRRSDTALPLTLLSAARAVGEVMAVAGEQSDAPAAPVRQDAEAVMIYLAKRAAGARACFRHEDARWRVINGRPTIGSGWTRRSPRGDDAADEGPKKHTLGSLAEECAAAGGAAAPNALAQLRPQGAPAAIHDAGAGVRDLQLGGADGMAGTFA